MATGAGDKAATVPADAAGTVAEAPGAVEAADREAAESTGVDGLVRGVDIDRRTVSDAGEIPPEPDVPLRAALPAAAARAVAAEAIAAAGRAKDRVTTGPLLAIDPRAATGATALVVGTA